MDSLIKFTPESLHNNDAFVEHLLSIIDTKLQYVEYRTSKVIKTMVKVPNGQSDDFLMDDDFQIEEAIENSEVFNQIEEYSRTTSLLLLMRTNLSGKNASLIYDLLSDDKFMKFNDIDLEKKLVKHY